LQLREMKHFANLPKIWEIAKFNVFFT